MGIQEVYFGILLAKNHSKYEDQLVFKGYSTKPYIEGGCLIFDPEEDTEIKPFDENEIVKDYYLCNHIIIYLHPEFIFEDTDERFYMFEYNPREVACAGLREELYELYYNIDIAKEYSNDKIHFHKKICNSVIGIAMDVHEDNKNVFPVNNETMQLLQNLLTTIHKRMDPRSVCIGMGMNCCS